ncbi:MAG: hypothetical protein ABII82_20885 [Verrucomicrobiota bacterium]
MMRRLSPELLDSLPATDPAVRWSRRDLLRVNRVMGNPAWFARTLPAVMRPGESALEIGAGDGALARRLDAAGLDLAAAPTDWPEGRAWHRADLRSFEGWADYPVILGNLILHHFDAEALLALGAIFNRHARVLLFSEPRRARRFLALWAVAAPLGGANHVTRHDGRVSIEAGFAPGELPRLLGLAEDWQCVEQTNALGALRLIATRRP